MLMTDYVLPLDGEHRHQRPSEFGQNPVLCCRVFDIPIRHEYQVQPDAVTVHVSPSMQFTDSRMPTPSGNRDQLHQGSVAIDYVVGRDLLVRAGEMLYRRGEIEGGEVDNKGVNGDVCRTLIVVGAW